MDKKIKYRSVIYAILAALLYGISSPMSKLLLVEIPPTLMAALLYLGAGIGMLFINLYSVITKKDRVEANITIEEVPYVIGMILLDILAPILLMIGLTMTTSANASLLNNFEIVATSIIALFFFKETVGKRMWVSIGLITLASIILSLSDIKSLSFSMGSVFVILACISWGFENNCTRMISLKNPIQIVVIKGFGSGIGSIIISFMINEYSQNWLYIFLTLILGFIAYGLSIFLYIIAQRNLGASRTSAFYAMAPFMGVLISWLFLKEPISQSFLIALSIMILGTYFAVTEEHSHLHIHSSVTHNHNHQHDDNHHNHVHSYSVKGFHSHEHIHEVVEHKHHHFPDMHHIHSH